MTRKSPRRFANYSKQNEEQYYNNQPPRQQQNSYQHQESSNDSMIADVAQGFIQAQANMNNKGADYNNLEIALLLQKCNNQLEEIRRSAQGNSSDNQAGEQNNKNATVQDSNSQSQGEQGGQDNSQQQVASSPPQDLQGLLMTMLQGKNNNENSTAKASNMQNSDMNKTSGGQNKQNKVDVQTVSQVLAQAQYELANELENSLKKLKQVISESEKLANNINNLLGEQATNNKT